MNKILVLLGILSLSTTGAYAQTSAVRAAERMATERDPKLKEARRILEATKTHAETKDAPYTWYVAGLIEHTATTQEMSKLKLSGSADQSLMYTSLLQSLPYWQRVDSLERITDAKGKTHDKYTKKLKPLLEQDYKLLTNAGDYFLQQKDYANSSLAFEQYLRLASSPLLSGSKSLTQDKEKIQKIAYYAISTAYEGKEYQRTIQLANQYKEQSYQRNEIYQLLAASYHLQGDSLGVERTLQEGVKLFPQSAYYRDNLISYYMEHSKLSEAKQLLESALKLEPNQLDYLTTMGSLLEQQRDWQGAIDWFKKAVAKESKNVAINYALGRCYYNLGVSALEQSLTDKLLETKAKDYFKKAIPPLEQAYFGGGKTEEVRLLLSNLYFRLGMDDKTSN